jgi:hypothetical protein
MNMEEFRNIEAMSEDIASRLRELPTDYKLAERCTDIDVDIEYINDWFEKYELEKKIILNMITILDKQVKELNNDVEHFKLQEFSRDQHGGSYSRLSQIRRP